MASLINSYSERDLEQGLVEHKIEVLEIGDGKREPIIAEHNHAIIALQKFACYTLIVTIIFVFMVTKSLMDNDKEWTPISFTIFLVASFSSILVGIIIRFGRALHSRRMGPALPIKRIVLIGNVLLCISEGFFMVSIFAAINLLVPSQLRWIAIGAGLGILVAKIAFLAIFYAVLELPTGFVGMVVVTCLALAFRLSGLFAVFLFSNAP